MAISNIEACFGGTKGSKVVGGGWEGGGGVAVEIIM